MCDQENCCVIEKNWKTTITKKTKQRTDKMIKTLDKYTLDSKLGKITVCEQIQTLDNTEYVHVSVDNKKIKSKYFVCAKNGNWNKLQRYLIKLSV